MPKTARHTLVWFAEQDRYGLFAENYQDPLLLQGDDPVWFAWLASHTSFSFQGKHGSLSLQKEVRARGSTGYWYAYRRQGKRMVKHYVGQGTRLTMARLEAEAQALGARTQQTGPSSEEHSLSPAPAEPRTAEAPAEVSSVPRERSSRESHALVPHVPLLMSKLHPPVYLPP